MIGLFELLEHLTFIHKKELFTQKVITAAVNQRQWNQLFLPTLSLSGTSEHAFTAAGQQ